jgi:hypothetical protein
MEIPVKIVAAFDGIKQQEVHIDLKSMNILYMFSSCSDNILISMFGLNYLCMVAIVLYLFWMLTNTGCQPARVKVPAQVRYSTQSDTKFTTVLNHLKTTKCSHNKSFFFFRKATAVILLEDVWRRCNQGLSGIVLR